MPEKDDKDPEAEAVASIEAALADESTDHRAADYDHDQADGRERTEVEQVLIWPGASDAFPEGHFVHRVLDHNPEHGRTSPRRTPPPEEAYPLVSEVLRTAAGHPLGTNSDHHPFDSPVTATVGVGNND